MTLFRVAASVLVPLSATLATLGCSRVAAAPRADGTPSQVRLVWTESPQSRATVAWSSGSAGEKHVVHYDTDSHGGGERAELYRFAVPSSEDGRYSGEPTAFFHHARLEKLLPDTRYWFVVESDGLFSPEFWFRTAPADDAPVTFLQGGDSRSGRAARQSMNAMIARLVEKDPDILCLAHGGDYVYHGTELGLWMQWMNDHERIVTEDGRMLPVVPARGNHEATGPQYDEVFGTPGGGLGKNWFATKLSPQILLVTLNTETAHGGPQARFLAETAAREASTRWKLAQYHRPMWPAVKKPTLAKPHWQPVFDDARFDIVLESDGHTLRKTVPILGSERHDDGVIYIGEGGFGVRQRTPDLDRWYLEPPGFAQSAHHVWKVTLTEHTVECSAIGLGEEPLHSFHRSARPRPPAHPENVVEDAATRDG